MPLGGDAGADLLEALDRSLQEGWFEPAALAPVARLLGASDVLVRNDLAYERYRTAAPARVWPLLLGADVDLGAPTTFGGPYDNVAGPVRHDDRRDRAGPRPLRRRRRRRSRSSRCPTAVATPLTTLAGGRRHGRRRRR